jgi:rfaE bifunctional protein nucleotidyltransferase chain/domain
MATPGPDGCFARYPRSAALAAELCASLERPIVFTHGVFDLLHAGHVACLQRARSLGSSLVVGIHTDASARRLGKGPMPPCHSAADRARVVAALAAVSAVMLFDEDKPLALMYALRPDIYVKGGDHVASQMAETALMAEWGGRTVIVPHLAGLSTTRMIEHLRGLAPAYRSGPGRSERRDHLSTASPAADLRPDFRRHVA